MKNNKTQHVRYEYGRKMVKAKKRHIGLPGALSLLVFTSFGVYMVWAQFIPNPLTAIRTKTDRIAASIVNQPTTPAAVQQNAVTLDPNKVAPKTTKIKRKNKELIEQIAIKARVHNSARWSVYVEDIDSGVTAAYNADNKYSFGEVSRLALLPGIETKITPDRWQRKWFDTSVSNCVTSGLGQQNDACYDKITKHVGQSQLEKSLSAAGYDMAVDKNLSVVGSTEKFAGYIADMKRGQVLQSKTRRVAFDALYKQKQLPGLVLGCGDCRVANKQGKSGNAVIDAGIITHGAKSYVVVIVGENGTFDQITDFAQTIDKYMKP
jgi:Beta-lactamase enzyme family